MEIPFVYGKIVSDNDFTDREEETRKLVSNFLSQTNTAIISPRRWGKSSLVNKAIETVSKSDNAILFVKMNAFKCETPQDFYELFAKRTIECISSTAETLLSNAKEFISRLLPKLSISDPAGQYEMSFGVDLKNNPIGEDILDLPQQIASKRKRKVVVCIDEFQQIGEFAETDKFQKILRSHWQEQTDVAYILYGSKKHMMLNIFGEYGSPFSFRRYPKKTGSLISKTVSRKPRSRFLMMPPDIWPIWSRTIPTMSSSWLSMPGSERIRFVQKRLSMPHSRECSIH